MQLDNISKDKTVANTDKFTKDQQNAINGIIDFISKDFNPANYIVGLVGAGGTGKTFITRYIINHCRYSDSVIKCTSPTHKACRVFNQAIGGKTVDTIQSTFGFRLDLNLEDFDPNNPQFNPMSKPKIDGMKLLIIDESSMLPAKLVTYICNRCRELRIKIIFIGDIYQLFPVNERKSIAFNRCSKIYELKEIVRQGIDNPINKILPIIRNDIANRKYDFINYVHKNANSECFNELGEGFKICDYFEFKSIIDASFKDEAYTKNIDMYRIVSYTNNSVSNWNNYVRNAIIKNADKDVITKNDLIMSYSTIVGPFNETIINNSEEYIVNDIINFVDKDFGFKGFLVKFQLVHGGNITSPIFVIDHKDNFTIMKYFKVLTDLINSAKYSNKSNRASLWRNYYAFKKKYLLASDLISKNTNKMVYSKDIDYGFAITSHKSQGSTYENVFVDLNDMIYTKNGTIYTDTEDLLRRIYVACSRAKKKLVLCYG